MEAKKIDGFCNNQISNILSGTKMGIPEREKKIGLRYAKSAGIPCSMTQSQGELERGGWKEGRKEEGV